MTSDPKAPLPDEVHIALQSAQMVCDSLCFTNDEKQQLKADKLEAALQTLRAHIAALEAREQRLREAADIALGHMTGGLDGNWADCDPVEKLRAALAQTDGGV